MRNIISNKTLAEAVAEGGLEAAQQFPTRCTGDTLGAALKAIGEVMRKHKESNGNPVRIHIDNTEVLALVPELVNKLELKGFSFEPVYGHGVTVHYHVFEGK